MTVFFWILAVLSLLAAAAAVMHVKPLRCFWGLTALMVLNSAILLLAGATVLAFALLAFNLAAAGVFWIILRRIGEVKLGAPGRARLGLSKIVAGLATTGVIAVVVWSASGSSLPEAPNPQPGAMSWTALAPMLLLVHAGVVAWFVVRTRRLAAPEETPPAGGGGTS